MPVRLKPYSTSGGVMKEIFLIKPLPVILTTDKHGFRQSTRTDKILTSGQFDSKLLPYILVLLRSSVSSCLFLLHQLRSYQSRARGPCRGTERSGSSLRASTPEIIEHRPDPKGSRPSLFKNRVMPRYRAISTLVGSGASILIPENSRTRDDHADMIAPCRSKIVRSL